MSIARLNYKSDLMINATKFSLKFFFLLVLTFHFANSLNCQEWASKGTKWVYSFNQSLPSNLNYYFHLYESVSDTIIDTKLMHRIDFKQFSSGDPITLLRSEIMYMENNRIYFYKWNRSNLLYDFNLHIGDDYILQMPDNATQTSVFTMTYDDNWNFNNKEYRIVYFDSADELYFGDYVMENVGSMNQFFPTSQSAFPPEYEYLNCFITGDSLYYYESLDFCEYFRTAYISELETSDLKFYPNPISNLSTVFIPEEFGNIASIKIRGINGQSIPKFTIQNRNIRLDKSDYESGIYFMEVETSKQKFRGKFVVE